MYYNFFEIYKNLLFIIKQYDIVNEQIRYIKSSIQIIQVGSKIL